MLDWHIRKSRIVTRVLFRLRTGPSRFRAHLSRFVTHLNPTCHEYEEEIE